MSSFKIKSVDQKKQFLIKASTIADVVGKGIEKLELTLPAEDYKVSFCKNYISFTIKRIFFSFVKGCSRRRWNANRR